MSNKYRNRSPDGKSQKERFKEITDQLEAGVGRQIRCHSCRNVFFQTERGIMAAKYDPDKKEKELMLER